MSMQDVERMQQNQQGLQAAIDAGTLWMEPGVAERAAARCDAEVARIDRLIRRKYRITDRAKFGDNEDGNAAAERFAQAGRDYLAVWRGARTVVANMAQTYRNAGAAAAAAEEASEASMRGLGL